MKNANVYVREITLMCDILYLVYCSAGSVRTE